MTIIRTKEDLDNLLLKCIDINGTDLYFSVGTYPAVRIHGVIKYLKTEAKVTEEDVKNIAQYIAPKEKLNNRENCYNCTFPYSILDKGRFRVNLHKQRRSYCVSFRIGKFYCPTKAQLRLPDEIENIFDINSGLIIISGAGGSGRTATSAYILDRIRQEKSYFIDTIEDPIEFLYKHDKSVINQMEVGIDIPDILAGLKIALRNYSDIIFISSFVDKEVIKLALESARAGKTIIAVAEIQGVVEVIKNIIDIFPNESTNYIRTLLASSIKCVVSQQLITDVHNNNIPLCEILYGIKSVSNIIKENKISQLPQILEASHNANMLSIDNHLVQLFNDGQITIETAKDFAQDWNVLTQRIVKSK